MTCGRQRVLRVGLAAALAGVVLTGVAAARHSADSPFTGTWQTTRGTVVLRPGSSNVVEWGEFGNGGRLCGVQVFTSEVPSKLELGGLWYQGGPTYTPSGALECGPRHATPWGRFYFTLSSDGKSFTGGYTTTGDGLRIGNPSSWPAWNGTKSGSTPPGTTTTATTTAATPTSAQKFAVTVSGTGTFNPGEAKKNVFSLGSYGTYRLASPRISLSASVLHNISVKTSPPKLQSGTAEVQALLRKIHGSGKPVYSLRLDYKLYAVDDLDVTAKGQAFAFKGKLTKPTPAICKTLDIYSDPQGMLDFTICGVGGTGRSTTRIG